MTVCPFPGSQSYFIPSQSQKHNIAFLLDGVTFAFFGEGEEEIFHCMEDLIIFFWIEIINPCFIHSNHVFKVICVIGFEGKYRGTQPSASFVHWSKCDVPTTLKPYPCPDGHEKSVLFTLNRFQFHLRAV